MRTNRSSTPSQSLATTCENQIGNSSRVTPAAASTRCAGRAMGAPPKTRHTAARPTSQIRYCGLITRLVVVKSSTAVKAASASVLGPVRRARSRHSSSQPNAAAVSPIARVETSGTYGPRNSTEP